MWNYRVRASVQRLADGTDADRFDIIAVYHDRNDSVEMWAQPLAPHGMSLNSLREDAERMLAALDQPIIRSEDLPR